MKPERIAERKPARADNRLLGVQRPSKQYTPPLLHSFKNKSEGESVDFTVSGSPPFYNKIQLYTRIRDTKKGSTHLEHSLL